MKYVNKDMTSMMSLMFAALALFVFSACDLGNTDAPEAVTSRKDAAREGFMMLNPAEDSVRLTLGTNQKGALAKDGPAMKVTLDYVFSVGEHEITCGEYSEYMEADCSDKDLPITDVTYYDAVLFANERSKAEKYDTAYSYKTVELDGDGHCVSLEGFSFDASSNGYRLPTEAEWVFAAEKDFSPSTGWNADNSDYELHEVCTSKKNGYLLCDMLGNAMEWVNDWLGNFRDTTIVDYAGAPDGGSLGERIVKGGSYRNAPSSINLYSRGDVYTVTSSTRAPYVGFRLAAGAIKNPVWLSDDGSTVASGVNLAAESSTIKSLFGTYKVKLAFRNDVTGNLSYVNYGAGGKDVIQIKDTLAVYHPSISPDGKRVAFCTGMEGISGKSELYVRDLNTNGSNLVKLDVESAAVPRWRVIDGDTMIVYVDDAGNNKTETDFMARGTWQVKFENGKFGIPEKLFDGAYHGGISDDDRLAVTGARLLRARLSTKSDVVDSVWYDGEQACNASLALDKSKRTAFLDFGGEPGKKFVGTSYDVHERLLVADSTGKLIQSVAAPKGYAFDHTEWVKLPSNVDVKMDPVVATLTNANGAHEKIVLVNLKDSSTTTLAEGQELWHPDIWTSGKVIDGGDLDLDSAGVYLAPGMDEHVARYRVKMELFWKHIEETEVILVGSSRMERGIDPNMFPEWNMLNFGVMGPSWGKDLYFIENYILNHGQNLKAIAVSLDMDAWRDNLVLLNQVVSLPGYVYDKNHKFWKDGVPDNFVEAVSESFAAPEGTSSIFDERGGCQMMSGSWDIVPVEVLEDSIVDDNRSEYFFRVFKEIETLIETCKKRNIHLIGVIFPQAPQYKETGSFGVYGLQWSYAEALVRTLKEMDEKYEYFHLMDEYKMGNHDYSDKMAYDRDHLSELGARQATTRLDSLLKTLELR